MQLNFGSVDFLQDRWRHASPFPHVVIDNFLPENIAEQVASEFPGADSDLWHEYSNPLEVKKSCSDWNKLPPTIYQVFFHLLGEDVRRTLSDIAKTSLIPDVGLHGGGLHCHKRGGKLNYHLDYSLHPKLGLQRKVNIILYVSRGWEPAWNGSLGLWGHDPQSGQPGALVQKIDCLFNRAVIFDTTMNSWHGLCDPVACPEDRSRNSLAAYYLCEPDEDVDTRGKALYAPTEDQKGDQEILDLIQRRANLSTFAGAYKTGER